MYFLCHELSLVIIHSDLFDFVKYLTLNIGKNIFYHCYKEERDKDGRTEGREGGKKGRREGERDGGREGGKIGGNESGKRKRSEGKDRR